MEWHIHKKWGNGALAPLSVHNGSCSIESFYSPTCIGSNDAWCCSGESSIASLSRQTLPLSVHLGLQCTAAVYNSRSSSDSRISMRETAQMHQQRQQQQNQQNQQNQQLHQENHFCRSCLQSLLKLTLLRALGFWVEPTFVWADAVASGREAAYPAATEFLQWLPVSASAANPHSRTFTVGGSSREAMQTRAQDWAMRQIGHLPPSINVNQWMNSGVNSPVCGHFPLLNCPSIHLSSHLLTL